MADMNAQLNELIDEKSKILNELKAKGKIEGDYEHSTAATREKQIRIKQLEKENKELELQLNQLQQTVLALKKSNRELNDMVFQISNSDSENKNAQKMVEIHKAKQELEEKLRILIEENEALKRKETELTTYSFMNTNTNQRSFKDEVEFPGEASMIERVDQDMDDDERNLRTKVQELEMGIEESKREKNIIQEQVLTLESENEELKKQVSESKT